MPLVPKPVYSSWFAKTSWMHRQFAYLFVNPLWEGRVPSGASLCPYFWLALFSAFVFRPFVYTLLGFGRLIKALNLGGLIRWTDRMAAKVLRLGVDNHGGATLMAVLILLMISLMGLGIYQWIVVTAEVGAVAAPVLALSLTAVLLTCGIYAKLNEYNDDRCKVEVYSRLATVASIVVAFVWYPSGAVASFIQLPWEIITGVFGVIWWCITETLSLLWSGVSWTGSWLWSSLPIIALILGVSAIVGLLSRFALKAAPPEQPAPEDKRPSRDRSIERLADVIWGSDMEKPYCGTRRWYAKALLRMDGLLDRLLTMNPYEAANDPALVARLKEVYEAEQRAARLRDERCKRTTEALARLMAPFAKAAKQVGMFCAYMWEVIKHRKAGACPYMRFED